MAYATSGPLPDEQPLAHQFVVERPDYGMDYIRCLHCGVRSYLAKPKLEPCPGAVPPGPQRWLLLDGTVVEEGDPF